MQINCLMAMHFDINSQGPVYELTDVDKLYLALVETGQDSAVNTLYYFLNITSIKALKEFNPIGNNYGKFLQPSYINTLKYKICDKHFDFQKLALVRGQALLLNFFIMLLSLPTPDPELAIIVSMN